MAISSTTCHALDPISATLKGIKPGKRLVEDEAHVFISFDEDEQNLADHIKRELEKLGFKCLSNNDIMPGDLKLDGLERCIKRSSKMIVIITEKYLKADAVNYAAIVGIIKGSEEKKKMTVPILHEINPNMVPTYMKEVNYIQTNEAAFWERLLNTLNHEIPLSALVETRDIAEGLAWGYYYNYLCLILPGLKDRMRKKYGDLAVTKFILLLPESGLTMNLGEIDTNFQEEKLEFNINRRDFGNTVVKVKDPATGRELCLCVEFATPLRTMFEMERGSVAGLSKEQKTKEIIAFGSIIQNIIRCESASKGFPEVVPLSYDDLSETNDEHYLSRMILERIS